MASSLPQTIEDRPVEVEWQFDALDLRPVERWLRGPMAAWSAGALDVPALESVPKPPRRLVDRYLDTDDWRIGRAGFVLRTRRRGSRDEATLKDTRPAGDDGLRRRLEVTEPLPASGQVAELGDRGPVGRRVSAVVGNRPLRQVLEVRTRRRPYALRIAGQEVAEICLDDTVIDVGSEEEPARLLRVEIEVLPVWLDAVEPLVEELRGACGLQPATLSKFEAGLLAAGLTVPGPPDLGATEAGPGSTMGELAYAVIRRHLAALLTHEPGTRLGEDPEELHDMRVATRRLRAAMELFAEALPVRAAALREEVRWLTGVLGAVRDLDVQLGRMDELEHWAESWIGTESGGPPLAPLRELLEQERDQTRAALLAALDSSRWERLVGGLTGMARHGPSRRTAAARIAAVIAVPGLVATRHRSMTKAAKRAKKSGRPEDYHRLRKRGKRLRYSLEFTADLYGKRTTLFTKRLARLQDQLGLIQDAHVITSRLRSLAEEHRDALPSTTIFAMGGVAERYRIEADELLADMAAELKVLRGKRWHALWQLMEQRHFEAVAALPFRAAALRRPPAGSPAASETAPADATPVPSTQNTEVVTESAPPVPLRSPRPA